MSLHRTRKIGRTTALLASGLVAGGVLAGTLSASAADSGSATPPASAKPAPPQRPEEKPLTGDTLAKVKAAVSAKYPGATFVRVETDSDGAYEAHITKKDGTHVAVEVSKAFAVTGEEQPPPGDGPRGHGGPPPGAPDGTQPG